MNNPVPSTRRYLDENDTLLETQKLETDPRRTRKSPQICNKAIESISKTPHRGRGCGSVSKWCLCKPELNPQNPHRKQGDEACPCNPSAGKLGTSILQWSEEGSSVISSENKIKARYGVQHLQSQSWGGRDQGLGHPGVRVILRYTASFKIPSTWYMSYCFSTTENKRNKGREGGRKGGEKIRKKKINSILYRLAIVTVERRLLGQEGTQVYIQALMSGSSQLPATLAPGDPMPSASLHGHTHTCAIHWQRHTDIF